MKRDVSWLSRSPIAHRGLHDETAPENSRAAAERSIAAGYPIELDIQFSLEGIPFVFHDDDLERMTGAKGAFRQTPAATIRSLTLPDGSAIPEFTDFLECVAGRVPLLVEIKTTEGVVSLLPSVYEALDSYSGDFALQSFNPFVVLDASKKRPDWLRGQLSTSAEDVGRSFIKSLLVHRMMLNTLSKPHFVSVRLEDVSPKRAERFRRRYDAFLTWTVRSPEAAQTARALGATMIFEGFTP